MVTGQRMQKDGKQRTHRDGTERASTASNGDTESLISPSSKLQSSLDRSPSLASTPPLATMLPIGKRALELGKQERLRLPRDSIGSLGLVPQCRSWDRGDLMRRLATYKAMTQKGKAQGGQSCELCQERLD